MYLKINTNCTFYYDYECYSVIQLLKITSVKKEN